MRLFYFFFINNFLKKLNNDNNKILLLFNENIKWSIQTTIEVKYEDYNDLVLYLLKPKDNNKYDYSIFYKSNDYQKYHKANLSIKFRINFNNIIKIFQNYINKIKNVKEYQQ